MLSLPSLNFISWHDNAGSSGIDPKGGYDADMNLLIYSLKVIEVSKQIRVENIFVRAR